ncbi:Type II secretion system F domain protein OS=Tsukamurella paurometabola (strain ATCC 8368 / DSM/ CCUG 35730 / CIP 100753 / JCM 10117 / KCTC 9821 / NBRC 16120 / NCIMB 702349 / NCTC 13040) OX=521096 GN=Tpau_3907 PE=4 SV=1 [Tsukamurella paurometabola]|uniref:Type II secretion system F domain protein n=1 Tax=Tsukamurella paurometabola (strain ATCC 8368 / DSM 20162 / CCUG 35730 / CIP 100753 / JCM 10117 / KCTC 9821 / NBRC 16120 / NCIMB 702349 / NCTC 13040) TaxID=521096 RepID=D5UMK5_TSUPD|nr:type II secretion system F family protein [Tsukamurella paurometabola]ADG80479.1 Type II secretion system F domain protein [Tsukamurella paurometabola DSM 20162]SUP39798.1 Flp pilus assembly protein TadB [Tsukamurella paurometabola]
MTGAVALLAIAALVWPAGAGAAARLRAAHRRERAARTWRWGWLALAVPAGALLVGPGQALAGALLMGTGRELWSRSSARRARTDRLSAILAGVDAMVAELSVGAHPAAACATAGRDAEDSHVRSVFAEMAGRAELGGDVAAGLRLHASESTAWERLAAAWETGTRHGIGMGELLASVREDLRARERYERRAHSALAGARATAQVLAALPVLGVAMGQLIGADPLGTLLSTGAGGVLLVVGVCLTCAGLLWSRSIADGAAGLDQTDRAGQ